MLYEMMQKVAAGVTVYVLIRCIVRHYIYLFYF